MTLILQKQSSVCITHKRILKMELGRHSPERQHWLQRQGRRATALPQPSSGAHTPTSAGPRAPALRLRRLSETGFSLGCFWRWLASRLDRARGRAQIVPKGPQRRGASSETKRRGFSQQYRYRESKDTNAEGTSGLFQANDPFPLDAWR